MKQFKRPDQPLKDLFKGVKPGDIDKRSITIVKAPDGGEGESGATVGVQAPTSSQLAKINKFTRTPKTADQVAVIPSMACNDLIDRDVDRFRTATVQEMHDLTGAYDPVGKSFMIAHDTTKLPVGRIFDKGVERQNGTTFLKLDSYVPNTETNKAYLENVDYGVYWAVSVGVMLGKAVCDIGEPHPFGGGWFGDWICTEGHIKGFWYEPDGETDKWDYPIPVAEGAKGAVLCVREFEEAKDFYELSQVYLGAQYFAQLADKSAEMDGIIKAASAAQRDKAPKFFPLGSSAAKFLPLTKDERVLSAMRAHKVVEEEGELTWVEDGIKWIFDADTDESMALGTVKADEEDEEEEEKETIEEDEEEENEEEEEEEDVSAEAGEEDKDVVETHPSGKPSTKEGELTDEMTIEAIVKGIKLPKSVADKAGEGLEALVQALAAHMEAQDKELEGLRPKAALGDAWIEELKKDTIAWYVKAYQTDDNRVSVKSAEDILAAFGDNVALIKSVRQTYIDHAQAKFPNKVRRSTFNTLEVDEDGLQTRKEGELPKILSNKDLERIRGIHG